MATDSISTSALHPEHRRFIDLKARAQALGYELIADNEAEHERGYYVLDLAKRQILVDAPGILDALSDWVTAKERAAVATDTAEVLASQKADDAKDETDERPEITVLVGDHCDTIYGLNGIAQALVALDEAESIQLAIAARELAKHLYGGLGSLLPDVEKRIEQATGMRVQS